MIRNEQYRGGLLVSAETIDLDAGTITVERDGKVESRPLTAEEARAFAPPPPTVVDTLVARIVAAQDPVTPPEWRQPTGAHDAYLPGEIVACDGKRWRNDLTIQHERLIVNVWRPGTLNAGWVDLAPPSEGPQPWKQPTGAHDA